MEGMAATLFPGCRGHLEPRGRTLEGRGYDDRPNDTTSTVGITRWHYRITYRCSDSSSRIINLKLRIVQEDSGMWSSIMSGGRLECGIDSPSQVPVNVSVGCSHDPIRPSLADAGLDPTLSYSGYDCVSCKMRNIDPGEHTADFERKVGVAAAHDRQSERLC